MDVKSEFKSIVKKYINRDGVDNLLNWLEQTDFYTAPASSKFHGSFEGGLVTHSLNVFNRMKDIAKLYENDCASPYSMESIAMVSLFHDLCKVDYYKISTRNVKNEKTGQWEKVPYYAFDEKYHYGGHGSKSVFLVMNFVLLTPEEAAAINCHMGPWDRQDYGKPGEVYDDNLLAWMLHVADGAASYINKV